MLFVYDEFDVDELGFESSTYWESESETYSSENGDNTSAANASPSPSQ